MKIKAASTSTKGATAFTYMEAVVGAAIMGILFVTFYTAISSGFTFMRLNRENLRATQIMLNRVEGLRLYNWNQLVSSNWIPTNFTTQYFPLGSTANSGITYTGTLTISRAILLPPATYDGDMARVTVRLSWVSGGVLRTRHMSTYVARWGMQNYLFNN